MTRFTSMPLPIASDSSAYNQASFIARRRRSSGINFVCAITSDGEICAASFFQRPRPYKAVEAYRRMSSAQPGKRSTINRHMPGSQRARYLIPLLGSSPNGGPIRIAVRGIPVQYMCMYALFQSQPMRMTAS